MLWDRDLPQPIAQWGQQEDGAWRCPEGNWGTQGRVLSALTDHFALTRNRAWLVQAYPSVQKGADRLITALAEQGGRLPKPATAAAEECDPNLWAARGLEGAARMAAALDKGDDAERFSNAHYAITVEAPPEPRGIDALRECMAGRSWQGFLPTPADATAVPDAGEGARFVTLRPAC